MSRTIRAESTPASTLEPWSEGVWTVSAPQRMMGLHLGTRMTVVRLEDGSLLLHSPVPLGDALRRAIDALGRVAHIVAPSLYHHLHAGDAAKAYPDAVLHAPAGLARKRPDLTIGAPLGAAAHAGWGSTLVPLKIEGSMLEETVFVHPASRSVISSDLAENFTTSDHFPTRMYLKVSGVHGKVGWSRLLRFVYRDRAAARRSVDALLAHDFDRVIVAHGDPIARDGKDALRETFRFL